ncbi:barstar family protein [Rhodanobacter ginsengisoli]|uniref:Barstar family protein n=1 Tax=Rhodanobacter ginsengisoli TaxID=418646 RepID=A0ABW0QLF2_9GAMM
MSTKGFDLDLTRPAHGGVYFVGVNDLDRLARAAARDELGVRRIDLAGCRDKDELLRRLAISLQLPATFGHNWDALADCLRDLGWIPAWGHVLLFEHADELRRAAGADFDILLGILDDAATFGQDNDRPWFAFVALPDSAFDAAPTSA